MAETKDFSYVGEAHFKVSGGVINPTNPIWTRSGDLKDDENIKTAEVSNVQFLTPAKITFTSDCGENLIEMAYVDLANRQVFDKEGKPFHTDAVFNFLDSKHTMPEGFYRANEEITAKAAEVQDGFAPIE
jgi:hypothetical protein